MSEPTIRCPQCKTEIKLTESLAAPLIESVRSEYETRLAQKDADVARREETLRAREEAISRARQEIEDQVAARLQQERAKVAAEEARKARLALETDLDRRAKEIAELQEVLRNRNEKLAEAQKAEADFRRKERELEDARREIDLNVEKRVQENLQATRLQARKEAEEELRLKVSEKEHTIAAMQKQIEDLKRRAEQGSQQLQGEVLELDIESHLADQFPQDRIEPVSKGERGADILQRVIGPAGKCCGTIAWETKRAKNWSKEWVAKIKTDQRNAKAEQAVIVSRVLPGDIATFGLVEDVWVAHPSVVLPVALMLRQSLIELAMIRQASEGQQTKMDLVYRYLTGPEFRQRLQAIVDGYKTMKSDLERERSAIIKQWNKREKQIEVVLQAALGMYGDLQGIAGKTAVEIKELELQALEGPDSDADDS